MKNLILALERMHPDHSLPDSIEHVIESSYNVLKMNGSKHSLSIRLRVV